MVYVIRSKDGTIERIDASLVESGGDLQILEQNDIEIVANDSWTSPETGIPYPAGWDLALLNHGLSLSIVPVLANQELDTSATTGAIYWEGQSSLSGSSYREPVNGLAYVELTGYDERT